MPEARPEIPADIKRRLMIECGHRCAVCGEPTSLEKAHIIPWQKKKAHTLDDLIVLCAVCHQRSHDEKWDRLTLREYKKKPWVARYRAQVNDSPRAIVEFHLDLNPEKFGHDEQNRFLGAVSAALDICPRDAVTVSIRLGSLIVGVELPADAVAALQQSKLVQDKVRELVAPVKLVRITFKTIQSSSACGSFTEANTVEKMILDSVAPKPGSEPSKVHEDTPGWGSSLGGEFKPAHWDYTPAAQLPRLSGDVMVESWVREALIRLNPEIKAQPDRADEVIYNLRACILSLQADGLVRANENFTAWLRGDKTMPFGRNGEHVTVRLVDTVQPANNRLTVCNQWTYQAGAVEKRFDIVFLVNGLPLVIGEAKTPTRNSVTWFDGAFQINEIYEKQAPAMFVPNVFSFATEGRLFRYGSVRMPIDMWGPWRDEENQAEGRLHHVRATVESMLRPEVVLDIMQNFTLFATDKKHRRIKIICRYQQYFTTNQIVSRVVTGYPKKGLIWHFQGSGKSLLMVFAAQKLRMHPKLGNPTVIIVVDRIDLDTQITATFNASDVPNMVAVANRQELQTLLAQDVRKVLITTIHKFGESSSSTGVPPVSFFNPYQKIEISKRNLPHWKQDRKTYFVTFRLADSLPAEKLSQLKLEREQWTLKHGHKPTQELSPPEREEYFRLFRHRVEEWLDQGAGACVLADPEIGRIVADALLHFEGKRYCLGEWIVMPNHVHVVLTPEPGEDLPKILHSWKSFTAKEINRRLGRKGTLWQEESYNHLVRNEKELYRINEYIAANPEKAGIKAVWGSGVGEGGNFGIGGGSRKGDHRRDACATFLNERSNIIVMVDEAHRTQEGGLGRKMREALPNAFLFGLTGTPINRSDRNTYWAFGADEDEKGYMSRYSFQDSIRDKATLPLHFEAPEVKLKIDRAAIDEAYREITGNLSEQDRDDLAKRAAKMAVLVKNPERVSAVVSHIVKHFETKVEPNGFKAQVVVFDRECCVLYKAVMDDLIDPDASAIVMTAAPGDPPEWKQHVRDKDTEEKLLDRFRDPIDPLKFVIVTSKLLTGFDAPILQVMYLDKPMKDHNLLQAICRTNRTFGQEKTHGLIVDYIGIFDDVARALDFDEKAVQQVVSNIDELRKGLPLQLQKCLAFFPGVDRSIGGYEGLVAAQQCLPNNEVRDKFAGEYSVLGTIWEALSPDPILSPYEKDYRWLTQVYESVKPPSGNGKLLWHALGAKTVQLINENVHVESVRDDVETLVLDAQVLEEILKDAEPGRKAREIEIKLIARLRRHAGNPKFTALGERLERIKERHEQGFLSSLEFLKSILEIAKEVLEAERESDPEEERNRAIEALTELFKGAKNKNTDVIVERIVADIDDIVKKVRFPAWQQTTQGERLVQKELRRTLLKYKLHTDQELFDKAYAYVRQYY